MKVTNWVRPPPEYWPAPFKGIADPVAPLVFALYGHPDSGGYWERHCETQIAKCNFLPVPNWSSVFYNSKTDVLLMTYVDDFKASGPADEVRKAWVELRKHINMEDPRRTLSQLIIILDALTSGIHPSTRDRAFKFWNKTFPIV